MAQKADSVAKKAEKAFVLQKDNAPITLRQPSAKRIESFRNSRDYRYEQDFTPPDNPIAKFWAWIKQKINDFFRSKAYDSFWQYVFLAIAVALAAWLIYKSNILGNMFGKQAAGIDDFEYRLIHENIHEINFSEMIDEAVEQRNYRLAVRLYYLKTLKHLSDQKLIAWKPTKTNRTYLYELENSPYGADFERITEQFEYIWYGEFPISEMAFGEVKTNFQTFFSRVNDEK